MANMTEDPEINRIPLRTVADYSSNPSGYRAEKSWTRAVDSMEKEAVESLKIFRDFFNTPFSYGKGAQAVIDGLESGKLTEKKANEIIEGLSALSENISNRGLFNALFRFYHIIVSDLSLFLEVRKNGNKGDKRFKKRWEARRNLSSVALDRWLREKKII